MKDTDPDSKVLFECLHQQIYSQHGRISEKLSTSVTVMIYYFPLKFLLSQWTYVSQNPVIAANLACWISFIIILKKTLRG